MKYDEYHKRFVAVRTELDSIFNEVANDTDLTSNELFMVEDQFKRTEEFSSNQQSRMFHKAKIRQRVEQQMKDLEDFVRRMNVNEPTDAELREIESSNWADKGIDLDALDGIRRD